MCIESIFQGAHPGQQQVEWKIRTLSGKRNKAFRAAV